MVSEPVTSERKKSLTGRPGWSAAGNDACASAACGWARDWAGVVGLRLRRGGLQLGWAKPGENGPQWRPGPSGEERGRRGKEMGRGRNRPSGRKEGGGESHFFSFSNFSSKQAQNAISTQFEIRLQTKQFKITCSGMNAHSWLLTYI